MKPGLLDTESFSSSEEEDLGEVDEDDPDYRPPLRKKYVFKNLFLHLNNGFGCNYKTDNYCCSSDRTGGALKSKFSLDTPDIVSIGDTVHDEPDNDCYTAGLTLQIPEKSWS